jgi:hypothetical protein
VFYAGAGNDTLVLNDSNISRLSESGARVDGGTGVDTLKFDNITPGVGVTLDLTTLGNTKITSIERFDLTGIADNTLQVSLRDLLVMEDPGGQSAFNAFSAFAGVNNKRQVVVVGDSGDSVVLTDLSDWTLDVNTVDDGISTYSVYNHNTAQQQLLVHNAVAVL